MNKTEFFFPFDLAHQFDPVLFRVVVFENCKFSFPWLYLYKYVNMDEKKQNIKTQ
jgi:hypothetical protein